MAYYELEPWGNTWRQTARQCALHQNIHAGKGKRMSEDDFMPFQKTQEQKTADIEKFLRTMANKIGQ